jgi:hypothetical protein
MNSTVEDEVDAGPSFAEACRLPAAEYASGARPWASRGGCDRHRFTRQCGVTGTPYPFGRRDTDAEAVFTGMHGLRKRPGMARALGIAALALPVAGRNGRPSE